MKERHKKFYKRILLLADGAKIATCVTFIAGDAQRESRKDSCDFDFNICGGTNSVRELVSLVLKLTKSDSEVVISPGEPTLTVSSSVSSKRTQEILGFYPKVLFIFIFSFI